jgi:hypothetical protein
MLRESSGHRQVKHVTKHELTSIECVWGELWLFGVVLRTNVDVVDVYKLAAPVVVEDDCRRGYNVLWPWCR